MSNRSGSAGAGSSRSGSHFSFRSPTRRRRFSFLSRRGSRVEEQRETVSRTRNAGFLGTFARLDALSERSEQHNGAIGAIECYDVELGRFVVVLPGGEKIYVRAQSVQQISDALGRSVMDQDGRPGGGGGADGGRRLGGTRNRAKAEAHSQELIAASAHLLSTSPVRPKRADFEAALAAVGASSPLAKGSAGGGGRDGSGMRLGSGHSADDHDLAPLSAASKDGPPRPWEWRPATDPAPRRPPVRSPTMVHRSRSVAQQERLRRQMRADNSAAAVAMRAGIGEEPSPRDAAPLMRRPPRHEADVVSTEAFGMWRAAGMPAQGAAAGTLVYA